MKTYENNPIFTDEQLNNMTPENLIKIVNIQKGYSTSLENQVKLYQERLQEMEFLNALLSEKLTLAQKRHFGSSSEKYSNGYEQINLFNEAEQNADPEIQEPQYEEVHPYFEWLHTMDTLDLDRKSKIGDAILYSLNQEKYLRRYLEDGHLSIDNNACLSSSLENP